MTTLDYILKKFNITYDDKTDMPIEIPNVGRNDLVSWLHELNFKVGVEVGVSEGVYSEIICKANPQLKLYGIDPWEKYGNYKKDIQASVLNEFYRTTLRRMSKYPNYEIIKDYSSKAVGKFADQSLDFVYIDANHKDPYITEDITLWSKKIRPGGIISGHDYIRAKRETGDVISAVNRYVKINKIRPWFIIGSNGKIPGTIRDATRSWMWIIQ